MLSHSPVSLLQAAESVQPFGAQRPTLRAALTCGGLRQHLLPADAEIRCSVEHTLPAAKICTHGHHMQLVEHVTWPSSEAEIVYSSEEYGAQSEIPAHMLLPPARNFATQDSSISPPQMRRLFTAMMCTGTSRRSTGPPGGTPTSRCLGAACTGSPSSTASWWCWS